VVFEAAVSGGLGWLAVVMAVNTVIALAYYLYWIAMLFATPGQLVAVGRTADVDEPAEMLVEAAAPPSYRVPGASAAALGVLLAASLVLSVLPQLVLNLVPDVSGILG